MPTKAEQYAQMADQVARQLTGSWQEWAGFLTTAGVGGLSHHRRPALQIPVP